MNYSLYKLLLKVVSEANKKMSEQEVLRKVEYTTRDRVELDGSNASPQAETLIKSVSSEQALVLRVRINTPVFIEHAALLTSDGIKEVCEHKEEETG